MQIEDYFDFLAPDDIRLKGTRVGIETILYDFIHRSRSPEEIAQTYRSLTLEQVYATITYYLHNKEAIDRYLTEWLEHGERMAAEQDRNPHPSIQRLRALVAERRAAKGRTRVSIGYLLDENVGPRLKAELLRAAPDMAARPLNTM